MVATELHGEGCVGIPRGEATTEAERPIRRAWTSAPQSRERAQQQRPDGLRTASQHPARGLSPAPCPELVDHPVSHSTADTAVSPLSPGPRGLALDEQVCRGVLQGPKGLSAASPTAGLRLPGDAQLPTDQLFRPDPNTSSWFLAGEARGPRADHKRTKPSWV